MVDDRSTEQRTEVLRNRNIRAIRTFVGFCISLFILAGVAILLMPQVRSGESPTRTKCHNNLKNIGIAIHNYYVKYGCFPPAYTVDGHGHRMHSWRVLILEFLDPDLYAKYNLKQPWNSPTNLTFAKTMKKDGPYRCPTEEPKDPSWTSYVMLVGPTAFSDGPHGRKPKEIIDGTSNTIEVIEMSPSGILWTSPYDLNVEEMSFKINDPERTSPRSCHGHGVAALFVDGGTEFINTSNTRKDEEHLKALVTINGGEDMSKFPSD